mmetsp:Transcript_29951/g.76973  ORF Transcript_29951/g.76973 Transcript_29951/m.76973 type:complete len:555 (-) Transcript_29951:107-1771(-)
MESAVQARPLARIREELAALSRQAKDSSGSPAGRADLSATLEDFASRIDGVLSTQQALNGDASPRGGPSATEYERIESAVRAKFELYIREVADEHRQEKLKLQEEVELHLIRQERAMQAEVERMQRECAEFEEEVRQKYEELLAENTKQRQQEARARFEQVLEELNIKAIKGQGNVDTLADIAAKAEAKANARYRDLLEQRRREWKQDEDRRVANVTQELEQKYQGQIDSLHSKLEAASQATNATEGSDRQWAQELRETFDQQLQEARQREEQTIAKLTGELEDLRGMAESQKQAFDLELDRARDEWEEEREQLVGKTRKMKIALSKWRYDYLQAAKNHYAEVFAKEQEELRMQVKQLQAEVVRCKDKERTDATLLYAAQLSARSQGPSIVPAHISGISDKLAYLRQTLYRLWDALEVGNADIRSFLFKAEQSLGDPEQLVSIYERECQHLADRLPIMQSITRREYLRRRMSVGVADDAEPLSDADMSKELEMLNEQLSIALRQYERKYHTPFLYKGRSYLDALFDDSAGSPARLTARPELGPGATAEPVVLSA